MRAVIALLHADMHQSGTVGSVCHLATAVVTVAPGVKGDEAVAKITKRSKSGKVTQDVSSICSQVTILSASLRNDNSLVFVLRRRFSALKRILRSQYRTSPVKVDPNSLRNRRCNITTYSEEKEMNSIIGGFFFIL